MLFFIPISLANEIRVQPAYDLIHENTVFDVLIYCTPTEPIKAYEFKIDFNPGYLQAVSIEEGGFFGDYPTFYDAGIINNTQGTIKNIYELVIGQGNVTTPGTLVIIRFNATLSGVSSLHLYDAGVTNETRYLSLIVKDGGRRVYGVFFPWDVNDDGHCNYLDLSMVVSHYAQSCDPGSQSWDIIPDGQCNYLELSLIVSHYGLYTIL